MVEGQRQGAGLTHHQLPVDHPGRVFDLPEREDGRLTGGEDRGAGVHPEHADVGDRDGAANQVGRSGLARPPGLGQRLQAAGQFGQRQGARVLDVRHDEATLGRHRDAEVHVVLDHDLLRGGVPRRVDERVPGHRDEQRPGHEQQRRHPQVREFGQLADAAHRGHRLGHVDLQELGDVRRGERARHHGRGHVPAHPADTDALLAARAGGRAHGGRLGPVSGYPDRTGLRISGRCTLHVVPGDRAIRAAARQLRQAEAEILGQLAHGRLGQRPDRWCACFGGQLRWRGRGGLARAARGRRGLDAVADQDRVPFGLIGRGAIGRSQGGNPGPFGMIGFFLAGSGGRLVPETAAGARHLDRDDRRADLDGLALCGQQPGDGAVPRRRQLDHRLGRLDLHDDLAVLDLVPRLDVPGHDVGFGQALARVGQLELLQLGHDAPQ